MNVNELFFARIAFGLRLLPLAEQEAFLKSWVGVFDQLVRGYHTSLELDRIAPPPPPEFAEQHAEWLDIVTASLKDATELGALGRRELTRHQPATPRARKNAPRKAKNPA